MRTNADSEFTVVSIRNVKEGENFLPIERSGPSVYVTRKHRWERTWQKASKSYRCVGYCRGVDDAGKDGVFSIYDWAVVRRPRSTPKIDRLVAKWGKRA